MCVSVCMGVWVHVVQMLGFSSMVKWCECWGSAYYECCQPASPYSLSAWSFLAQPSRILEVDFVSAGICICMYVCTCLHMCVCV